MGIFGLLLLLAIVGFIIWRLRKRRAEKSRSLPEPTSAHSADQSQRPSLFRKIQAKRGEVRDFMADNGSKFGPWGEAIGQTARFKGYGARGSRAPYQYGEQSSIFEDGLAPR
jgi:hypothetical protein